MKSDDNIALSVVVTAHHEGIVAHKTILSILRALEPVKKAQISYEIVIHLDAPDDETRQYFARYQNDERFRILPENNFRNPADSRNFAVQHARGTYIAIIDGDDLFSRNWLIDGYNMIVEHKGDVVLRPNFMVHFGSGDQRHNVWILDDSFSKDEDALIMAHFNRWPNMLFTSAKLLHKFPFQATVNGFGYEDWLFNCEVTAAGIPSRVVPGATLFYRMRRNSVTVTDHSGAVLPYSNLFDIDYIKSIKLPPKVNGGSSREKIKTLLYGGKKAAFAAVKQFPVLERALTPHAQKIVYNKQLSRLPQPLMEAWEDINSIDSQLYPTVPIVVGVRFHPLSFNQHDTRLGAIYKRLVDQVTKKPDYVFLVPQLIATGGTEKLLANYISAIKKAHPDWHIAIVSAKPKGSPFDFKDADFINFAGATKHLSQYERESVWSRLLIQLEVKRLHIIAHEGWLRWIADHRTLIEKNGYTVNISMFMREYTHERGRILSLADPFLRDIHSVTNKIFTDNQNIINEMLATNAFDPNKLVLHYQPAALDIVKPKTIKVSESKPLRILWASRLSYQKRVDILKKIAQKLDPSKFHIDVYGRGQDYSRRDLSGIASLTYKGDFNGISSVPTDKYDAYLYTSDVDGVPNILLEVAAAGLPIIASNDGGVSEVVANGKTGILVDVEDVDGYVKALKDVRSNPDTAKRYAEAAQTLLLSQHSAQQFEKNVAKDIN